MTTTIGLALRQLTERFGAVGIPSARLDARLLLAHALGVSATTIFSHPERPLSEADRQAVAVVADRRERREPVSHILGCREFWSLNFKVTADTLDPRPDTETVVEAVLDAIPDRQAPLRLLDLGTGTGCILLSLLSELPNARGVAIDVSAAALEVARHNARSLGLDQRVSMALGHWGRGMDGLFDVIVSNPPYIPDQDISGLEAEVAVYEPRGALAGGPDGLDCYRDLAPDVGRLLVRGGVAAFEVGQGQAEAVGLILRAAGLSLKYVRPDLAGIGRCVVVSQPLERSR